MKIMTIFLYIDGNNLLQLKQLQNIFNKTTNCSVVCKPTFSSAVDYLSNEPVHTIITNIPAERLISACGEMISKTPIVVLNINDPGFPMLQLPFTQAQADLIIARYTKPCYKLFKLEESVKKLEKQNAVLQHEIDENERYLRRAAGLQNGLLKTTQYNDFSIYTKSRPVRRLGGDFYYYKRFNDHLYFCIGDVVDHGADAAIYMTELLSFFISLLQTEPDLLTLVKEFNRLSYEYNHSHMTATAVIGCLDLESGDFRFCNQGHEPPILVSAKTCELESKQIYLPLGVEREQDFELSEKKINKNDKIFLYTDGLTEEFNNLGIDIEHAYGLTRLLKVLEQNHSSSASELGNAALRDMENYIAGADQNDDITIFVFDGGKTSASKI